VKALKPITKKSGKLDRERKVLLGLVDYYLKTGKPVGSHTLKEVGFDDLSSATIRNYFARLEDEGYLTQQHISGGRIPTDKAYRLYANAYKDFLLPQEPVFTSFRDTETREIATLLQGAAESLAEKTQTAVFLSAPRFEQDFIIGMKLVVIDATRCLCVLVTDFGDLKPEVLYVPHKLSAFTAKRLEAYFNWRLNMSGHSKPQPLSAEEEQLGQELYSELMVRYIVSYSQFANEEIYRTGFSTLLHYPEFHEPATLANTLSLFENTHGMLLLLKECSKLNTLKFWIGEDLKAYSTEAAQYSSIVAAPYHVGQQVVGAVGLLGPMRVPYRSLFALLNDFTENISNALTRNLYKFKISVRQPKQENLDLSQKLIGDTKRLMLEDKRLSNEKRSLTNTLSSRRK
jgi:heat-inducible transcriptional repressor